MISPRILIMGLLIIIGNSFPSCKKGYLDENPRSDITVPSTLETLQSLLDLDIVMNITPALGELSSDNYYLTTSYWKGLINEEHNAYVWAGNIYGTQTNSDDWFIPCQQVFYANVVLDGLNKLDSNAVSRSKYNATRGAALFVRAYAFYSLAQVFAPVYDSLHAHSDLGIPLRLSSGVDEKSARSTVEQTYKQILQDLAEANGLLPVNIDADNRNRPSRPACMGMLARVYLSMRKYSQAGIYADSCLQLYNTLIDYNTINVSALYPFSKLNSETLYQSTLLTNSNVLLGKVISDCLVDSVLYASYDANDLRRAAFYMLGPAGLPNLKGSYNGSLFPFTGLSVDEIFLIRSECLAWMGNVPASLNDLNTVLQNRWKAGTFIPVKAISVGEALKKIRDERRKELAFRGLRWTDIRRLNKEGAQITLTRFVDGIHYLLPPNDPKYILPIPPDVISLSGMQQNQR